MSTQAENGSFDASVAVRAVRGKLRGSWAERRWWRLHVPALHHGSQPVAVRFAGHHGMEEVRGSSPLSSTHVMSRVMCDR